MEPGSGQLYLLGRGVGSARKHHTKERSKTCDGTRMAEWPEDESGIPRLTIDGLRDAAVEREKVVPRGDKHHVHHWTHQSSVRRGSK